MARAHPATVAAFLSLLVVGCRASAPGATSAIVPEPARSVRAAIPFDFAYDTTPGRYRFSESTRLRVQVDSASREATFNTVALTTLLVRPLDGAIEIITVVDSGGVPTGGPVLGAMPPRSRILDTVRAGLRITEESTAQCATESAGASPATFRFFVPLPARVTPDFSRRDTVVTVVCQRAIPVRASGARNVTAAGTTADGLQLVRVRTEYVLSGKGVEGQHNVTISGSASAVGELSLHPVSGRVVHGSSDLRLTMTLFASGRPATMTQETRSSLELVRD